MCPKVITQVNVPCMIRWFLLLSPQVISIRRLVVQCSINYCVNITCTMMSFRMLVSLPNDIIIILEITKCVCGGGRGMEGVGVCAVIEIVVAPLEAQ